MLLHRSPFLEFFLRRYRASPSLSQNKTDALSHWRERIVAVIFTVFLLFGGVSYIPSVYLAIHEGKWLIAVVDTLAYAMILYFFFVQGSSLVVRASALLCLIYTIAITLMFSVSPQYALIWLFALSITSAVLIGFKASCVVLIINLCTLVGTGILIAQGIVLWEADSTGQLKGWAVVSINFMLLSTMGSLSIATLVEGLKHTIDLESLARKKLLAEHIKLEKETGQRLMAEQEKQVLQDKLILAQKMEAIGMMAGGVAHDLNNILSGIVGYPELLLQTLPKESELRKPLEAIHDSGQRAATVVADLLTVARGVASIHEIHDLNLLVQEYIDSPECKKLKSLSPDVICRQHLQATPADIFCSSVHVKKCIMNLITNAAEAIAGHGTVTVSTHNQYVENDKSSAMEAGEYIILSVKDSGPGIAEQDLEHIFEPFYTKKLTGRSGTGLGLAVVWNTMKDHNGKVVVQSDSQGTCFQLFFPSSHKEQQLNIQTNNSPAQALKGDGEHILVVDDEPQLRDLASKMLVSIGYTVDSVCSGELAITFVKDTPVDLIVLDMLMEPGMNGHQTYKEIRKLYPGQKAIVASGFSESDEVKATLRLGAGGFIKKPYSMSQLSRVVKEALHS